MRIYYALWPYWSLSLLKEEPMDGFQTDSALQLSSDQL